MILAINNEIVYISTNMGRDTILQRAGPEGRKERQTGINYILVAFPFLSREKMLDKTSHNLLVIPK